MMRARFYAKLAVRATELVGPIVSSDHGSDLVGTAGFVSRHCGGPPCAGKCPTSDEMAGRAATIGRVGGFYNIVPRRYAHSLGNALRFNTTVNSLSLDVYKLTQPDRGKPITNGQLGILAQPCGYQFGIADSMLGIDYYIRFELA
jgi:hypothetical protein